MNKPFFANFLEEQDIKQVTGGNPVAGGVSPISDDCHYMTNPTRDSLEIIITHP
jgi:hypothetical protein